MTNTTTTAPTAPVFTEENPRFHSDGDMIIDKIHGGNLPIAEIVYLLNNAEFTITEYKAFEGKLKWACKSLPSAKKQRGFEG